MATAELTTSRLEELLGDDAADLLRHESTTVPQSTLHLPGPDWVDRFIDNLEVRKGSVTPHDVNVFARNLSKPGHLQANLAWFRTLPEDMKNDAVYQKTKLPMPVLAIGASASLGAFVGDQAKKYATNVTSTVIPDSGHWIYEEHPAETTALLLTFLSQQP